MYELMTGFVQGFFAIGVNACLLPLYPGVIAFLATQVRDKRTVTWLGVPVLAGITTMMLLIALVVALLRAVFIDVLAVLLPVIYLIVIVLGVLLLTGRNPFARMETGQAPVFKNPYLTAYVYGLLLGPMTLPCTGVGISTAIIISSGFDDVLFSLLYYVFFAVGFGIPLLVLPMLAQPVQHRIVGWLTTHHTALNRAAGILLVAMGIFGILTEIAPQAAPALELPYDAYPLYWLVVAGLVVVIGWWTQQRQRLN